MSYVIVAPRKGAILKTDDRIALARVGIRHDGVSRFVNNDGTVGGTNVGRHNAGRLAFFLTTSEVSREGAAELERIGWKLHMEGEAPNA